MLKGFWTRDNLKFGMVIGLIVPLVAYFILDGIDELIFRANKDNVFRENIIPDDTQYALAVAANVFFFRHFMVKNHYDQSGKGILVSTFIYAIGYLTVFWLLGVSKIPIL